MKPVCGLILVLYPEPLKLRSLRHPSSRRASGPQTLGASHAQMSHLRPTVTPERRAMRSLCVFTCALSVSILAGSGCATIALPDIPSTLRPPAGQVVYLEALASGVQIYECMTKPAEPLTYEWGFRAPEAVLVDRSGNPFGKHYAGPTWESEDGSTGVGEVKARDPGPN